MKSRKHFNRCAIAILAALTIIFSSAISHLTAQDIETVVQIGHSHILGLEFSPDDKAIATIGGEGSIKLWNVESGQEYRTFEGDGSVDFSKDGKYIAMGSRYFKAYVHDIQTGERAFEFEHQNDVPYISSVQFSESGRYLATAARGAANMWDLTKSQLIHAFYDPAIYVVNLKFSPDKKSLAGSGAEGSVIVWDWMSGERRHLFVTDSALTSITFSPDNRYLAGLTNAGMLYVWSLETDQPVHTISMAASPIKAFTYSPNGEYLVTVNAANKIHFWDSQSGNRTATELDNGFAGSAIRFSNSGEYFAIGGDGVSLWHASDNRLVRRFISQVKVVEAIAFNPKMPYIAIGGRKGARIWNLKTAQLMTSLDIATGYIYTMAFSSDGKMLAIGETDGNITLWDWKTGKQIRALTGHSNGIYSLSFSPDGKMLASGSADNTVRIWNPDNGQQIHLFDEYDGGVFAVRISPDGKLLGTAGKHGSVRVWDIKDHLPLLSLNLPQNESLYAIDFSSDSKEFAYGNAHGQVDIWDIQYGEKPTIIQTDRIWITSLHFSSDGKRLLISTGDGRCMIYNRSTGETIISGEKQPQTLTAASVSGDGKYMAIGGWDGKAKIHDTTTGDQIASLVAIGEKDYISITSDFHYQASKNAHKGVAFRVDNKLYPFEQFDLRLNRPDVVVETLGYGSPELVKAYHQAYKKRLRKMNFTEEMLGSDFHLPEISLHSSKIPLTTTNKQLKFQLRAVDNLYNLDRLHVYVNDVPIYGSSGLDLRSRNTQSIVEQIELTLSNGRNKIQFSVVNQRGAESLRETFETVYTGTQAPADLYLVTIGVSQYQDERFNLEYAAKDAIDLETLLSGNSGTFQNIYPIKLLNSEATLENVLNVKKNLSKSRVDDVVVLFFAGHGLLDADLNYYLATTDIDFRNPAENGLPYEMLEGLLDGIPARKKLMMIDACHSGEVDRDETILAAKTNIVDNNVKVRSFRGLEVIGLKKKVGLSNSFQLMQNLFANLNRGSGAMVISAAGGEEFAYEGQGVANGVFTHSVLVGIQQKSADSNGDGQIVVSELRDFVTAQVKTLTGGKQTPTSRQENLEFDFRVN